MNSFKLNNLIANNLIKGFHIYKKYPGDWNYAEKAYIDGNYQHGIWYVGFPTLTEKGDVAINGIPYKDFLKLEEDYILLQSALDKKDFVTLTVDPLTVTKCLGEKDNKEHYIFENDIIRRPEFKDELNIVRFGKVGNDKTFYTLYPNSVFPNQFDVRTGILYEINKFSVVGNVFQHRELCDNLKSIL